MLFMWSLLRDFHAVLATYDTKYLFKVIIYFIESFCFKTFDYSNPIRC